MARVAGARPFGQSTIHTAGHPGPAGPRMTGASISFRDPRDGGDMPIQNLPGGRYRLGDLDLTRVGYGAMQLAGPGVFGPPKDRDAAIAVLRAAVDLGINHIDTSDYYGPHVTNEIIREALEIGRASCRERV